MNERTKLGLGILQAALLLGLLGDALLRATPWGLNVFLWVGVLIAALAALSKQRREGTGGDGGWLVPCVLVFAAAFAWRDSQTLRLLDVFVILVALALIARRTHGGSVWLAGLTDYALSLVVAAGNTVFGMFPLVFRDVRWGEIPRVGWSRHALAVARGLALAVPLVLVFGALLTAADAVFEKLVSNTFSFDAGQLLTHLVLIIFFTWVTAGFLRGTLLGKDSLVARDRDVFLTALGLDAGINGARDAHGGAQAGPSVAGVTPAQTGDQPAAVPPAPVAPAGRRISLGIVEIGVVLGLLNVLFLSFVVVQLRYLFGGAGHVLTSAGLTYADYARRGFFELTWVAGLVLPLLLAADWLLRREKPLHGRIFRVLAGMTVVLLFVIMVSAIKRMRLYQSEYGLTELRLYTTAFMGWLGVVFVWFAWTVLARVRRERFAAGALAAALVVAGALHFINPNALIVRTNVARAKTHQRFDAAYAVSLGADAVPSLVAALGEMREEERHIVAREVLDWLKSDGETDWRSWSWSRSEARRAIASQEGALREWAKKPQPRAADYQQTQSATAPIHGTGLSLAVERFNAHPFRFEYRRYALLLRDGRPLARIEMAYDAGGRSRVSAFRPSDSMLILQDAFDEYEVDLSRLIFSKRRGRTNDLSRLNFIGVFDLDESKAWRFIPADGAGMKPTPNTR
jgi:hypothetical protein